MFMLKSKHEKLIADAIQRERAKRDEIMSINNRALIAERSITASLRAEIEAMKPDYELGKKRRAAYDADNAKRKTKREAAKMPRTASETVTAIGKQTKALNRSFKKVQAHIKAIS